MSKPSARLIITAWGEEYIRKVLDYTLPAVLAPGNLPALSESFSCTVAFATEERLFDVIKASQVWQKLQEWASVKLLPIDDLVIYKNHYGISLTLALIRGFEDLGPKMTDTYLLFLNADFILADGSYRSLAARMLAGERLIHAPSYCVNEHEVLLALSGFRMDEGVLAISPRQMATLILNHRHNTIRGKTVNQQLFRMHRFDQFYWQVDDHTLLARQLPIALVCMKPERVVTDFQTFWDYGVVSEFCPGSKPYVFSDSDEFLMLELRDAATFRDQLRLGWASTQEIADDLSSFTTKDQREHGTHALVIHDQDLPQGIGHAEKEFTRFVDEVFQKLSPRPVSHLKHPFWTDHYDKLQQARHQYLSAKAEGRMFPQAVLENGLSLEDDTKSPERRAGETALSLRRKMINILERFHAQLFGNVPCVTKAHPYYSMLKPAIDALSDELARPKRKILLMSSEPRLLSKYVKKFVKEDDSVESETVRVRYGVSKRKPGGRYDLCIYEIDVKGLMALGDVLSSVRSEMAPQGRILVFCLNLRDLDLRSREIDAIAYGTLPTGRSQISLAGSIWLKCALELYAYGERLRQHYGVAGIIAYGFISLLAAPFSLIENWQSKIWPRRALGRHCFGITMDYRLF